MQPDTLLLSIFVVSIIAFVVFVIIFSMVIRDFDKRFSTYLVNASNRSKLISNQLAILHDTLLIISTMLKPACVEVLRKYITEPNNNLLRDMYQCAQNITTCNGDECCCTCIYQKALYALNFDEELKNVAVLCGVGDIEVISTEHGTCPLHEKRIISK